MNNTQVNLKKPTSMKYEIHNNTIVSPGPFNGQPRWAPHFWKQAKQGLADARRGRIYIFDITQKDIDKFPELTHYDIVELSADRQGFVTAEVAYEVD